MSIKWRPIPHLENYTVEISCGTKGGLEERIASMPNNYIVKTGPLYEQLTNEWWAIIEDPTDKNDTTY